MIFRVNSMKGFSCGRENIFHDVLDIDQSKLFTCVFIYIHLYVMSNDKWKGVFYFVL